MNRMTDQSYEVAIYLRLSKEDGDFSFTENGKSESNSIQSQRELLMDFLKKQVQNHVVKSKTAQKGFVELNVEIRMKNDDTDFINALSGMPGVGSAVLVSYNGEYMS